MTTCAQWQEAASAHHDGEDPGVPPAALEVHVATCADCQRFAAGLGTLDVETAARTVSVADRTTSEILTAMRADQRVRARQPAMQRPARMGLGLVGIVQLATAVPSLWSLVDGHSVRDLAAFQLALGIGFLVAAARPGTAAGLLPTAATLVGTLAVVVVGDVATGRVAAGAETIHLTEAVGVALLWLLTPRQASPQRPRLT